MIEKKCYLVYCIHFYSNGSNRKTYLCEIPNFGLDWTEKIWKKNQFIPTIFKTKHEANKYVCKDNNFEVGIEEITIKM